MRKSVKHLLMFCLICLLTVVFLPMQTVQTNAAVKLNKKAVTLLVGQSTTLKMKGTSKKVTWKSSNSKIAKVSRKGKVAGIKSGSTTVTATVSGKSYKCSVRVNQTFAISESILSIEENTPITATLTVNGSLAYKLSDTRICKVSYGKWNGDTMELTIVPLKKGSTTLTLANTYNKEVCVVEVTVTEVPVYATLGTPKLSDGGNFFVAGENEMEFPITMQSKSEDTVFRVYSTSDKLLYEKNLGTIKAGKKKTAVWDGMDEKGRVYDGEFYYVVYANGLKGTKNSSKQNYEVHKESPFGGGTGTSEHPFLVSNIEELKLMTAYNEPGTYFAQDANIDFNASSIPALFSSATPFVANFSGEYQGKSYAIENFIGYNSLFGVIGKKDATTNTSVGTVSNVTLRGFVINTLGSMLALTNEGTIENCDVTGNINCRDAYMASGLVMYNKGLIRNCGVNGNIDATITNAMSSMTLKIGGISVQNEGTISDCRSFITIKETLTLGTGYQPNGIYRIYTGGVTAENLASGIITKCVCGSNILTDIKLEESLAASGVTVPEGIAVTGYVAASNVGYVDNFCVRVGGAEIPAIGNTSK